MGNGNPASITNQPAPDPQETANNTEKQDDAQAISNGQSTASQSLKDNIPPPLPGDADEPRGADNASSCFLDSRLRYAEYAKSQQAQFIKLEIQKKTLLKDHCGIRRSSLMVQAVSRGVQPTR